MKMMRKAAVRAFIAVSITVPIGTLTATVLAQEPAQTPVQAPSNEAPEASPTDIDGETMFATSCGFCHQQGGRAAGRGPKLAGSTRSDEFIIERIKKGKPGVMPAYARTFSDGQIIAILAYIRGLEDSGG
jgi:mono/diheme cytochrome c family protein